MSCTTGYLLRTVTRTQPAVVMCVSVRDNISVFTAPVKVISAQVVTRGDQLPATSELVMQ